MIVHSMKLYKIVSQFLNKQDLSVKYQIITDQVKSLTFIKLAAQSLPVMQTLIKYDFIDTTNLLPII